VNASIPETAQNPATWSFALNIGISPACGSAATQQPMRTVVAPSLSPIVSHSSTCKRGIPILMISLVLLAWDGVLEAG